MNLAWIIHSGVTEERASPVAGNGPLLPLRVQGSTFNVEETAYFFEL
jgi:hypothetical protein